MTATTMIHRIVTLATVLLLIGLSFTPVAFLPTATAQYPKHEFYFMDPPSDYLIITTSPNVSASIVLTWDVYASSIEPENLSITFIPDVVSISNYTVDIQPRTVNVTTPYATTVTVKVTVPAAARHETGYVSVRGTAYFKSEPILVPSPTVVVEVGQYFNYSVTYKFIKSAPSSATIEFDVTNYSNGEDVFYFYLYNSDNLRNLDWRFDPELLTLHPGQTGQTRMHINYDGEVNPYEPTLIVQVISERSYSGQAAPLMKFMNLTVRFAWQTPTEVVPLWAIGVAVIIFAIVMAVVLVLVMKGPTRSPPQKPS